MRRTRNRAEELLRAVVHEVRVERLTFVAGSIVYHAFISILPLMLLVLTLVQRTQNTALRDSIVGLMQAVLTSEASAVIQRGLVEVDASVSLLGAAFLVWGACGSFGGWTPRSRASTRPSRRTPSPTSSATDWSYGGSRRKPRALALG